MSAGTTDPLALLASTAEGRAPVGDRLTAMLFLALLLHAMILLGVTFIAPDQGGGAAPGMEVLLVTEDIPESRRNDAAAYVAQRAQKGSGNTKSGMTETPSTIAAAGAAGTDAMDTAAARRPPAGGAALTSSASDADIRYYASPSDGATRQALAASARAPRSGRGDGEELVLRGVLRSDLWLSPDTRASKLAPYLDHWRRKVERIGTLNYPVAARRVGLTGSPIIEVAIRSDGRLTAATVRRSSGFAELDQAALGILKLASPFDPFPAELAAEHRSLRFSYQWEFTDGRVGRGALRQGRGATPVP
jgi:protein TonB